MQCLVVAALVVAAVGSPLPHDCKHGVVGYTGAVPIGPHYARHYAHIPVVHHVGAVPIQQYQATYAAAGTPAVVTANVQEATAAFMAAWNAAAARAATIQSTLVKAAPTGGYVIQVPKQVQATQEVQQATAQFTAAWNEAAQRATTVEHAVDTLSKPVEQTAQVQKATVEFVTAWEAAAQQASSIRQAVAVSADPYSAVPQQVQATEEVKRATEEFMAAWSKAAARVPAIQTTMYDIAGTSPAPEAPKTVGGAPQFTPSVAEATAEFMKAWNAAAAAAEAAPDVNIIMGASSLPRPAQPAAPEAPAAVTYAAAPAPSHGVAQPIQPSPEAPKTVGGALQHTSSVAQATAEFKNAWNAAAAAAEAAPDVNIIMGASSLPRPAQPAASQAPVAVTYAAAPAVSHGPPQPVQPTPEVQRATAAFMAAWNKAAARASTIQAALVKTAPSGRYVYGVPKQVQETEEVRRATAEFMAAWNAAARRVTVVEQAIGSLPQPVQQTVQVQRATAQFMAAWEAAAQQASAIRQAMTVSATPYSGAPQQVQATDEVKRATAEFMAAWRKAAARVPSIQTTIYQISGVAPAPETPKIIGGVPQFTPAVAQATAEFMKAWNAAAAAAEAAPDVNIIMGASSLPRPALPAAAQAPAAVTYVASPAPAPSHTVPQPIQPSPEAPKNVGGAPQHTFSVAQATAEFMNAWNAAAAAAEAAPDVNIIMGASSLPRPAQPAAPQAPAAVTYAASPAPAPSHGVPKPIQPSPEAPKTVEGAPQPTSSVAQATAEFMNAWNAAAAAAEAAPDVNIIMGASSLPRPAQPAAPQASAAVTYAASPAPAPSHGVPKPIQPSPEAPKTVGGAPQHTSSVAQATAEFMNTWNAAAAAAEAAPDVNIIMGASSQTRPAQPAAPQAPAAVTYAAAPAVSHGPPQPVQPTPEVQQATAAFMAAWNKAAARASTIQAALVKTAPSGRYVYQVPKQVKETEEVRRATAQFMEAWNAAARRVIVVEQAIGSLPQPVQQTAEVQRATSEFMAAWEAAAQRASTIRQAVTVTADPYSAAPQQVQATDEVKRATAEFMAAWRKASARVSSIQTTIYELSGTVPAQETPKIVGGVPQFTPSVAQATAEFMKIWNAAAAAAEAAPDVNIIMGASTQPGPVQPTAPQAPAAVIYAAPPAVSYGVPQPLQPTLEVQQATAAFMAAWNAAAERATKIQATLVKSAHTIAPPRQVQETVAVEKATAEFMAAWNAAAQRATVVEQAISTLPKQVDYTDDVKMATAEFMSSWHAAAQRASTIHSAVSTTTYGVPQQVQPTTEVQKATAEFMAAWNEAAARVPKIETTLYTLSGSSALDSARAPQPVSDTPEVKAAKKAFMAQFRAAQQAAGLTSVSHGVLPAPTVLSVHPAHHLAYTTGALHHGYTISDRIFAPFSGFPIYVKDC